MATSSPTPTPTSTPPSPGGGDGAGTAERRAGDGDDTDSGDASDGGGGGGGGGDSGPPPTATYVTPYPHGAKVLVRRGNAGEPVQVELPASASTGETRLTGIGLTLNEDASRVVLDVTLASAAPAGTPAFESGRAIGYVAVEADGINESAVEAATLRVAVDNDSVPAGVDPGAVRLYRYRDGRWHALDASGGAPDTLRAESPGLSVFAVAAESRGTQTPVTVNPSQKTTTANDASTAGATPGGDVSTDGGRTADPTTPAAGTENGTDGDVADAGGPTGSREQTTALDRTAAERRDGAASAGGIGSAISEGWTLWTSGGILLSGLAVGWYYAGKRDRDGRDESQN